MLEANILIIEEDDRNTNAKYEINPGFIHVFPFEILVDGQIRCPILHLNTNSSLHQTFTIRAWLSSQPNGEELFFRYHPTTGGISHLFYDEDISPTPTPTVGNPMRNSFSGITFMAEDVLIPLTPGIYYYNVLNMVLKTNAYELSFMNKS